MKMKLNDDAFLSKFGLDIPCDIEVVVMKNNIIEALLKRDKNNSIKTIIDQAEELFQYIIKQ
jgi:hypothetical protein